MLAGRWRSPRRFNPVTYLMEAARSLILDDLEWAARQGLPVVAVAMALMLLLSVRTINNYE